MSWPLLKKLADVLWHGAKPTVFLDAVHRESTRLTSSRAHLREQSEAISVANFLERFTVRRIDGEFSKVKRHSIRNYAMRYSNHLDKVEHQRDLSDFFELMAKRRVDPDTELREWIMRYGWKIHTLEEWTCIFPEAARAGDYEFIESVVRCHRVLRDGPPQSLCCEDSAITLAWHDMTAHFPRRNIPPLKFWSDKAASEFLAFMMGDKSISIYAYKARKKRLGLHSEKPTLVTFAEYTYQGKEHLLVCHS